MTVRHDWQLSEVQDIYHLPLLDLIFRAAETHRAHHDAQEVQVCKLINIKTGACPEDCSYCSQSARYTTGVSPTGLMDKQQVLDIAQKAKNSGVSRVCMGAAWREVKDNRQFEQVLDMVRDVHALGMEVCCTLGMLTEPQARRLEEAGLYAYNHNLDTSERYYGSVITTRTWQDRINTLKNVRKTGVTLCTGGIIGLGETQEDRISLLHTLCTMQPHPESVPVNILARVPGTPLEKNPPVPIWQTLRMIATARCVMPESVVRLSAGRAGLSEPEQALCLLAGANSIFSSDTGAMLTKLVPSPDYDADAALLATLGLRPRQPQAAPRPANAPREYAVADAPEANLA